MRWTLAIGAVVAAACSGGAGDKHPAKPVPPPLPGNQVATELPSIPAKIETTTSAPTDANAPDKRSPILDVLEAETKREMAALSPDKTKDPVYYLGYQLVEQRVVSIEAEGGAIVTDQDDVARNLDVDVRVGSPQLDNTRQLSDDTNGLNAPLT